MISKDKWAELIKDFHERGIPELICRDIEIPREIPLKRAVTIIGPRRAGKTYTMFQVIKSLIDDKIGIERIIYINLEKTDLSGCEDKDLINMLETYYEMYPNNKGKKIWLFFDEVQNVSKWEVAVRTIIDYENIQVFISGSSSRLLSKELATSMRGRAIAYTIFPFSFIDFLNANDIEKKKYFSSSERSEIINMLKHYVEDGGYPEAVLFKKEKDKILYDIIETTIYRDVIERYKIRNIKLLKLLIKSLINSAQREFSVFKFYNFVKSMGMKAGKNSLYSYIMALNDVFFVFPVRKFSHSYKEMEQSLPKIFVIDNGILRINGITDFGRLMENLVFIELLRREKNIYFYRSINDKEVDFVIIKNNKVTELIQVAHSIDDFQTKEREIKALIKGSIELKCTNLSIITWDTEGLKKVNNRKIKIIPLWKWLLKID